jgi:SH3-like domain-containing protein
VKEAVVLSASNVRNGPGENNSNVFTIPEGKIVSVISESRNWNNIKTESENKSLMGWIENSTLGSINA